MHRGVERILTLSFGESGNEATYLGSGWSGNEPGHRWMIGQTSEIWLENPGPGHDLILELDTNVLAGAPGPQTQRLLVGVRGTAIAHIAMHRPGTVGFHIPAALVAAPGPVRLLFVHPDFRRPIDPRGGTDDRQLSFAPMALRVSRVLPRPVLTATPPLPPGQMIVRFESLGENCEFGLVQRRLGAEPLGLLRFSFVELFQVLRGLRTGFPALGDPGTAEISVDARGAEYVIKETTHGIVYHTFQSPDTLSRETVLGQQTARLRFLRRKLLEDVANGEKIFVIKRIDPLRPEEVMPLYTALNDLGRNWLLWVVPAGPAHPSGTVEILLPGLLRGYVDRFAPNDNAHDISLPAWTALCHAAWTAVGGDVGTRTAG